MQTGSLSQQRGVVVSLRIKIFRTWVLIPCQRTRHQKFLRLTFSCKLCFHCLTLMLSYKMSKFPISQSLRTGILKFKNSIEPQLLPLRSLSSFPTQPLPCCLPLIKVAHRLSVAFAWEKRGKKRRSTDSRVGLSKPSMPTLNL